MKLLKRVGREKFALKRGTQEEDRAFALVVRSTPVPLDCGKRGGFSTLGQRQLDDPRGRQEARRITEKRNSSDLKMNRRIPGPRILSIDEQENRMGCIS
jgi:hypothetical protein